MGSIEELDFIGVGGRRIFHRRLVPPDARAAVLIVHGYAEHSGRYEHVMAALADRGFASYAPDHRGHGRTGDMLGYIARFDELIEDLRALRRQVVEAHPNHPIFLYAHSMGGLLGVRWLEIAGDEIDAAVIQGANILVPPYIPRVMIALSHLLSRIAPKLPAQAFYEPANNCRDLEIRARMEADPLFYKGKIRARTGSEMLKAMQASVRELPKITRPLLVLHGGADKVVQLEASEALYDGVSSQDKTKRILPDAFHELHNEPEAERRELLDFVCQWFEEHLG